MRRPMRAFAVLPLLLLVGCQASEDVGSSERDLTITPIGPGGDITVTVVVPDAVTSTEAAQNGRFVYQVDGVNVRPNVATRVAWRSEGQSVSIWYSSPHSAHGFASVRTFSAASGGELRVELGAFKISGYIPAAAGLDLDLEGYHPKKSVVRLEGGAVHADWLSSTTDDLLSDELKDQELPAFVGDYQWITNVGAPEAFHVTAGHLSDVNEALAVPFASVRLEVAEAANFPSYDETLRLACGTSSGSRTVERHLSRTVTVYAKSPVNCFYMLGNIPGPSFTLSPQQEKIITLHRIEVDDVTLSDEAPGTKVEGTWTLYRPGSPVALYTAKTRTGTVVSAGTYDLRIDYRSLGGTPQVLRQTIHVP